MARPLKMGLDYFPCDVAIFRDSKLCGVKLKHGYMGAYIYILLLAMIYEDKGYFIQIDDNAIWAIIENMTGKNQPTEQQIKDVIGQLVKANLFDKELYKIGILTSKRIQKTYYLSTSERKKSTVDLGIWLLCAEEMKTISETNPILQAVLTGAVNQPTNEVIRPNNEVNRPNNEVNRPNNEVIRANNTQSKVNKSKVKENREKESKVNESKSLFFNNKYRAYADVYECLKIKKPEGTERAYGTYVDLSDKGYELLVELLGFKKADTYIERLDGYIRDTGKAYPDHLSVILSWAVNDKEIDNGA